MHPIMLTRLAPAAGAADPATPPEAKLPEGQTAPSDKEKGADFATILREGDTPTPPPPAPLAPEDAAKTTGDPVVEADIDGETDITVKETSKRTGEPITHSPDPAQPLKFNASEARGDQAAKMLPPVAPTSPRPQSVLASALMPAPDPKAVDAATKPAPSPEAQLTIKAPDPGASAAVPKTAAPAPDEAPAATLHTRKAAPTSDEPALLRPAPTPAPVSTTAQLAFAQNTATTAARSQAETLAPKVPTATTLAQPAPQQVAPPAEVTSTAAPLAPLTPETARNAPSRPLEPLLATPTPKPTDASARVELPKALPTLPLSKVEQDKPVAPHPLLDAQSKTLAQIPPERQQTAPLVPVLTAPPNERRKDSFDARAPLMAAAAPQSTAANTTSKTALASALQSADQAKSIASQSQLSPLSAFADSDPFVMSRTDTGTAGPVQTQMNAITRADIPHHVSRQVAEALQHMPSRPVEISLNPDELGRVRLGVSTSEAGIVVSVLAERPETVDLMRRHINALEAAFQAIGYNDISFSFAGGDTPDSGDENHNGTTSGGNADDGTIAVAETPQTIHLQTLAGTGLDLRL